jgi:DNA-directed RNA polymerase subunit RPC12/RpoP
MIVYCPQCGEKYDIEETLIGRKVECECGHKWIVSDNCPEQQIPTTIPPQPHTMPPPAEPPMEDKTLRILFFTIRALVFLLGCYVIYKGIRDCHDNMVILYIAGGLCIIACAFVSFEKKVKRFYFICPNPNCGFRGELEYDPDSGVLGTAAYILLMQSAGVRTIVYEDDSVACPRCGMKTRHQR